MAKPIVAILYDFDKTLSTTDMQNYTFIPNLGMTPDEKLLSSSQALLLGLSALTNTLLKEASKSNTT